MKPRVFIGSSSEGLEVADYVKNYLSADYDCVVWNEDVFKVNDNFLETLLKTASLFDFGIMVFSADDVTVVRHKMFETPRDNVMFEFGLFLGRVGRKRAFVIQEEGSHLPSDLLGITIPSYKITKDASGKKTFDKVSLDEILKRIKKRMDDYVRLGELGLLPSTVLAIGYFDNFVKLVAEWICGDPGNINLDGKNYTSAKLKIVIPSDLDADIKSRATMFYRKQGYGENQLNTVHRSFPIHVSTFGAGDTLEIYDMPTTLNGIDKAIDLYFSAGHIGKSYEQQLAEDHEMANFENVLRLLITRDAFCKSCVEIVHE